jgi:hypothetical protein
LLLFLASGSYVLSGAKASLLCSAVGAAKQAAEKVDALKGHDFSRAAKSAHKQWALAPEGRFLHCRLEQNTSVVLKGCRPEMLLSSLRSEATKDLRLLFGRDAMNFGNRTPAQVA